MTWVNPPQTIIDWRDALLATPTIQALLAGLTLLQQQARFCYPTAEPADKTSLPIWVLGRLEQGYDRFTATGSIGSGTVEAIGLFAASTDIGTVEQQINVAQDLEELGLSSSYLYIVRARVARSSQPDSARIASADAGQTRTSVPTFTIHYEADWEG